MSETYFIREKKDKNYTVVDNTYIKDSSLSWKAKGLFTYILSLPEDWKIYMSELVNHSTGGKEELKTIIKELVQHGYIQRDKSKDEKGMFVGWSYKIIEQPESVFTRERENRQSENPTSGNTPLLSTNPILSTNEQSTTPSKPKRIKKEFVPPTIDEVTEYVLEKQLVIDPYKFIDWYTKTDWNDNQGKKITNWKNKAINWDSREKEKNPSSIPYSKQSYSAPVNDFNVECCGQKISRYRPFCIKCGKQFNMDGTEK